MYNVVVTDVNTGVNYMGKLKSRYTKAGLLEGRANNFKKAIVTLKDGDKIDFTVISNGDGSKNLNLLPQVRDIRLSARSRKSRRTSLRNRCQPQEELGVDVTTLVR